MKAPNATVRNLRYWALIDTFLESNVQSLFQKKFQVTAAMNETDCDIINSVLPVPNKWSINVRRHRSITIPVPPTKRNLKNGAEPGKRYNFKRC